MRARDLTDPCRSIQAVSEPPSFDESAASPGASARDRIAEARQQVIGELRAAVEGFGLDEVAFRDEVMHRAERVAVARIDSRVDEVWERELTRRLDELRDDLVQASEARVEPLV